MLVAHLVALGTHRVRVVVGVDELDVRVGHLSLLVLAVLTLVGSASGLPSFGGIVPIEFELDEVRLAVFTLGTGEEHVVIDHVLSGSMVGFVAEYDPSGALVVVVAGEGSVPDVLVPETSHAVLVEGYLVLLSDWACARLELS